MTKIEYRPIAMRDKQAIASYIALDLKAPNAALATIRSIDDALATLKTIPHAGTAIDEPRLEQSGYRKIAAAHYWIIYRVDENCETVFVERIIHQRRNIVPQMYYDIDFPQ